ncbi:DUF1467 family protein [Pseudooceanicola sediminis]|uniref:DUF1467 family protein n=1 Tax=Pseudooceanicola sediminis TaxID=2211117 RepID=A0A399IW61_9RHOB|nr:DUF1467 family protein [Pseudooceanicola sediminis]KAA2312370.1 DUF1467 family protein [Puniceibacterium sp. HSS470]RII37418.1 DUF1467 family protein [Pseudooceanicola sediminis]|tara:strand:+ start:26436 stop:26717 length:282 start_codon:yes stop_codon:yes gene_type:complete
MGITSAIVLYAVIWWMTLLCVVPVRLRTQQDMGKVTPGTQSGAPEVHHLKGKVIITTGIATVLFAIAAGIILSGWISIADLDWFGRMDTPYPT